MTDNHIPALHELQTRFNKKEEIIPEINIMVASGEDYNILLSSHSSTFAEGC
jgi:thiamine monophosphate kinase